MFVVVGSASELRLKTSVPFQVFLMSDAQDKTSPPAVTLQVFPFNKVLQNSTNPLTPKKSKQIDKETQNTGKQSSLKVCLPFLILSP